jgi:hypothetical protein
MSFSPYNAFRLTRRERSLTRNFDGASRSQASVVTEDFKIYFPTQKSVLQPTDHTSSSRLGKSTLPQALLSILHDVIISMYYPNCPAKAGL